MKNLLLALTLVALPLLTGCSASRIKDALGIEPGKTDFGPFPYARKAVFEAARDVLADEGYRLAHIDRNDWELQTNWWGYGSGEYYGNKRWRITMEFTEEADGTIVDVLAHYQRNSSQSVLYAGEEDWETLGADHAVENELMYKVRGRLEKDRDYYQQFYDRYMEEDRARPRTGGSTNYDNR